jgi:hypothetical protein
MAYGSGSSTSQVVTGTVYIASPGTGDLTIQLKAADASTGVGIITFRPASSTRAGSYFYTLGTKR